MFRSAVALGMVSGLVLLAACGADDKGSAGNTTGGQANAGGSSGAGMAQGGVGAGDAGGSAGSVASAGSAGSAGVASAGGGAVLDPLADADGDGLSNGDELRLFLDPEGWDSDDDGFTDMAEVVDAASPVDADGDGVIDALECDLTDNDRDGTYDTTDPAAGWQVAAGRFYPRVIANDGSESTRVEVRLTGAGITSAALSTPANFFDDDVLPNELVVDGAPLGDGQLQLFDDGSHGDRFAGDDVWSRDGITTSMAIRTATGGRGWVTFLQVVVTDGSGTEERLLGIGDGFKVQRSLGFYLGVVNAADVVQPQSVGATLQKSPHLLNIIDPETAVTFRRTLVDDVNVVSNDDAVPSLYKRVLDEIPGDVDFVVLFADHDARGTHAGLHLRASLDASGIGLVPYEPGPGWGSEGGFKSGLLLDYGLYAPLNHEIMHYWGVDLSPALGFSWGGGHWGVASTFGVLGGFDPGAFVDLGDGTYTIDFFSTDGNDWKTTAFSPIELYLAGLAAPAEVQPIVTMQDAVRVGETATAVIVEGTPQTVTIDDIIAEHGARVPSSVDSQKAFTMAFAVYSEQTLTASEMTWLDLFADFFGRESVPGSMSFAAASGGRATMTTALPALVSE